MRPRFPPLLALLVAAASVAGAPDGASAVTSSVHPRLAGSTVPAAIPDAATGDAFYLPPEPLGGRPGRLLRSEPIAAPPGARAWRVLARSRSIGGRAVAVSGIVVAPKGAAPKGGRPVVAWAHGTTGLADACAPSKQADAAMSIPWVAELLAAGYVVTATDYEGLGTPGIHPYLVGESAGRSVLDTVRAARALPVGASRRVVIAGHSQGGHAALFAGEIAKDYAPDLSVRGIASGAPVSDVQAFLQYVARTPGRTGFLVMGAAGYRAAYPELARVPLLTPDAEARMDVAIYGCVGQALAEFLFDDPSTVFANDPTSIDLWSRRLRENTAGNRAAGAPVLLWQGADDDLTPAPVNAQYVLRACRNGSTVEYRLYPGATHGSVLGVARDDVLAFFAARLASQPPISSCPG